MSAPETYHMVYHCPNEFLSALEMYRKEIAFHIQELTRLRYNDYCSRDRKAIAQAWRVHKKDSRTLDDIVSAQDYLNVGTSVADMYDILKDKESFPGRPTSHGKTKERLERMLWERLPQKCHPDGSVIYIMDGLQYQGSATCDWWIKRTSNGLGGLLYTKEYHRSELIKCCRTAFDNICKQYVSLALGVAWSRLLGELKKLKPCDESGYDTTTLVSGEYTSVEGPQEDSEADHTDSGTATPTQSQHSQVSAATVNTGGSEVGAA